VPPDLRAPPTRSGQPTHPHDHGGHGHSHGLVDASIKRSRAGVRAVLVSLGVLGAAAAVQTLIFALSGSVALLGDTLHNVADALTAVPLGIAFWLGRRAATRAYTYGFGRSEDLAGVVIVLVIAGSSVAAAGLALDRLLHPRTMTHLPWVLAAGA
jgi:cation diffusion facilitator family transporter